MKKKETQQNNNVNNGIAICDSIVMSVKKKRINLRRPESIIIAVMGYISVIMAFLGMFEFRYEKALTVNAAVIFSGIYILISLTGKKSGWLVGLTALVGAYLIYKNSEDIVSGFQYVYNIIYKDSYHTDINYYKHMVPALEKQCTTAFFVAVEWLLALVIYYFTIAHPNPVLPLLVTFPIIEVGLFNGIELPVFWGVLVVAYWLALLAMSNIDMGEYSGGTGGFVRKDNLFFPKRQMRLKVTEKCGIIVAAVVIFTGLFSYSFLKASDYRRSDEINKKRADIRDAVNSFSFDDIAASISDITQAFGFTFNFQNHKLGNVDRMRYKNTVDLVATFDDACDGAVYLKEYTGCLYNDNSWNDLPEGAYPQEMLDSFETYGIHPQDYPYLLLRSGFESNTMHNFISDTLYSYSPEPGIVLKNTVQIESKLRSDRSFSPYAVDKNAVDRETGMTYTLDKDISSKLWGEQKFYYRFYPSTASLYSIVATRKDAIISRAKEYDYLLFNMDTDRITSPLIIINNDGYSLTSIILDEEWENKIFSYAEEHGLLDENGSLPISVISDQHLMYLCSNPEALMAVLMEKEYRKFVYDNYLTVPEGTDMDEIREAFKSVFKPTEQYSLENEKLAILENIKEAIASEVTYSLTPGKTPQNRDFVNYFLLENKKGYCTHYATAGVLLARMAGIPARYATGYLVVGNDFNSNTKNANNTYTVDIMDNRGHAWAEVYLDGLGWLPFEFTEGYSPTSIDPASAETTAVTTAETTTTETTTTTEADITTVSHDSTEKKSENKTHSATTTHTTSAVTTVVYDGTAPSDEVTEKHLPAVVRVIIDWILLAGLITAAVYLRRKLMNYIREKRMMTGSNKKRIAYMYGYLEKLLEVKEIKRGSSSYADFAQELERRFTGHIPDGDFISMTDSALKSAFSTEHPTDEELGRYREDIRVIANNIYHRSGKARRFWLTYIKALM